MYSNIEILGQIELLPMITVTILNDQPEINIFFLFFLPAVTQKRDFHRRS